MATVSCAPSHSSETGRVLVKPITAEQSSLMMQIIVKISISNIAFTRRLCPENNFKDRNIHGVNMKILRGDTEFGRRMRTWMNGAFDAIQKQNLRVLIFAVHTGSVDTPALETYSYKFKYFQGDKLQCKVTSSDERTREHTTRRNISHSMKSRKLAMELFESCKMLDQFLKPLPEEKLMTMKLIYYNEVTPRDYEPLGFEASRNSAITYACEGIPQKYRVGSVVTKFHKTKLHLQSTLIDKKVVKEYKKNKQQQQVTGTSKESPNVVNSTTESCASTSTVTDICNITVQLTPEQPLQEPITESSSHADMLQFNVPKPRRRRAKSCSNCETHALANLKKRKTVSDGALKDKKMKRNTSIQVRKIVKKAKARKMCANTDSEDKIGNSAVPRVVRSNKKTAEVKNETGMNDSDATTTDMEIGETFTADTDEESGSSNSEFQKEQVSLSKSSVATETIRIRDDSPDPSEVFIKKEVNCCCWKMTEHEPMILCQHCKMWQHRICYGIMDGCGGGDFDEQMHYCVECASIDQSKPCTDKTLLGMNSEARMTMTLFRRAFELLQHHATITATLMQMKLMLSKKLIRQLVAQLMGKDILVAANPESTTFAVNQEQYGVWLGRLKRKA